MLDSPPPSPHNINRTVRALLALLLLSLIPALWLAYTRIRFEGRAHTVAVVMDWNGVVQQARNLGQDNLSLLAHYRSLGVNGVAVYEDVVSNQVQRGEIVQRSGAELFAQDPQAGFNPSWSYARPIKPGSVQALRARYRYATREVRADGLTWTGWAVSIGRVPAGPDTALIRNLQRMGYQVVYRPFDSQAVKNVAADWPDVRYIAFNGAEVVGADQPARLAQVDARLGTRVPAIIESTPQKGLDTLIADHPAIRLFSIRPEWQALLKPDEVADKFVLAARERSLKLLYVRPFDTLDNTDEFLSKVRGGLNKSGIKIGVPGTASYTPNPALRYAALLGPLLALALLALGYPLVRLGALVALGTLALVIVVNGGAPLASGALLAAVVFPALGLVLRRNKPSDWLLASGVSLMGVFFVAALGADRLSMLGLDPFRGVGLTLVVPLALFALSLLPRQDVRQTVADLYDTPLRLGDVAIILAALAAVALVVLRRGNTPAIGVSAAEVKVRALLQDNIIRPRFKELAGHPAAILGLSGRFPPYFANLLLLGGVVGQSSILNTFSHFHTPLLISLERAMNGILIGGAIGFVLLPLLAWGVRLVRAGPPGRGGGPGQIVADGPATGD